MVRVGNDAGAGHKFLKLVRELMKGSLLPVGDRIKQQRSDYVWHQIEKVDCRVKQPAQLKEVRTVRITS